MDKATYFAELEKELKGLVANDRQNIIAYYYEYMIDAESEGLADVEVVLGSPHTLAAQIKADIAMAPLTTPKQTPAQQRQTVVEARAGAGAEPGAAASTSTPYSNGVAYAPTAPAQTPQKKSSLGVVWAVVLGILAIPVGIPLAMCLVIVIIAVLATLFSLLVSLGVVVLGLFVAAVLAIVFGIILLVIATPVGVFYIGSGLAVLGISMLMGIGFWKLAQFSIQGVAKLFDTIRKKLANRKKAVR